MPCTIPITFVSTCRWKSSGSQVDARPSCCQTPAFRIATSIPPSSSRTAARPPPAPPRGRVTSTGTGSHPEARPPAARAASPRRALIATRAPRAASSRASAAPMPAEAPVTQTRLPSSLIGRSSDAAATSPRLPCREAGLAVGQVELPHAAERRASKPSAAHLVEAGHEPLAPGSQRGRRSGGRSRVATRPAAREPAAHRLVDRPRIDGISPPGKTYLCIQRVAAARREVARRAAS